MSSIETVDVLGQPAVKLSTRKGARALVSLYGGQVLGWNPVSGGERLYLSPQASSANGAALRGGIPVCFPQFSDLGPLPRHGFVRNRLWEVKEVVSGGDFARAVLSFRATPDTLALWPHAFELELSVGIEEERLDVELEVLNSGAQPFSFTGALHTYVRVEEVEDCRISGLYGLDFRDAADGDRIRRESGEAVCIDGETDRIYHEARKPVLLRNGRHTLGLRNENFADLVVWNPWVDKAAALADLPDRDFRHFLCLEAAAVREPVSVAPGESWWGRQTLVAIA